MKNLSLKSKNKLNKISVNKKGGNSKTNLHFTDIVEKALEQELNKKLTKSKSPKKPKSKSPKKPKSKSSTKSKSKSPKKSKSKSPKKSMNTNNVHDFKDWVEDHNDHINKLLNSFNDNSKIITHRQPPMQKHSIQKLPMQKHSIQKLPMQKHSMQKHSIPIKHTTPKSCNTKIIKRNTKQCNCNSPNCNCNTQINSSFINKQMHFKINNHDIYLIFEQQNNNFDAVLLINDGEPIHIKNLDEYKQIEQYLLSKSN